MREVQITCGGHSQKCCTTSRIPRPWVFPQQLQAQALLSLGSREQEGPSSAASAPGCSQVLSYACHLYEGELPILQQLVVLIHLVTMAAGYNSLEYLLQKLDYLLSRSSSPGVEGAADVVD